MVASKLDRILARVNAKGKEHAAAATDDADDDGECRACVMPAKASTW